MMERQRENWEYQSLADIAEAFSRPEISAVSFDAFDTLLMRPLGRPADLFELLDRDFAGLCPAQVSFRVLREEAEAILRRRIIRGELDREDVSLDDIYLAMETYLGVSPAVAAAMKERELEAERKMCVPRRSGAWLFQKALESGKPVAVISDMYLSARQITSLLEGAGYSGMAAVFASSDEGLRKLHGKLYRRAAEKLGVPPERLFHVGDDPEADCRMAEMAGLRAACLPKTLEVYDRSGCGRQVEKICSDLTDWEAAKRSVGIGAFRALAAEKLFDDPFRPFAAGSDYDADPYLVGYGALGMELLALVRWLGDNLRRDRAGGMIFLARDGYLPMRAYELYRRYHPDLPAARYLHVSRLSLLPAMIRSREDLFDLPTDISYQTPRKLLKLLSFCTKDGQAPAREDMDMPFTKDAYQRFITDFIRDRYDGEKHRRAVERVRAYLLQNKDAPVSDDAALFDMGYSGRIAAAIGLTAGVRPPVYYFHTDAREHFRNERRAGMTIRSFFDFNPYMESSLREYSYLEPAASCVGYTDRLAPIYDEGPAEGYRAAAEAMQKGAMEFVADFLNHFGHYEQQAAFRYHDAAMPMEAFLRYCSPVDRRMYGGVLIDDELWGGRRDINLRDLMETRLRKLPAYAKERTDGTEDQKDH